MALKGFSLYDLAVIMIALDAAEGLATMYPRTFPAFRSRFRAAYKQCEELQDAELAKVKDRRKALNLRWKLTLIEKSGTANEQPPGPQAPAGGKEK
jgi:hypothetical protein